MTTLLNLPTAGDLAQHAKPPINIVIIYADRLTRRIAMNVWSGVGRRIRRAFAVQTASWSIDALRQPEVLELAATAGARADMIFCSVYASERLPAAVKAWADRWLPRTLPIDRALVALLKTSGQATSAPLPAENDLSALAEAARMDFFVKVFDVPGSEASTFGVRGNAQDVRSNARGIGRGSACRGT